MDLQQSLSRDYDSRTSVEICSQNSLLKSQCILNKGIDEELTCWGYRDSAGKKFLYCLLVLLSLGSLLLIVHWKPALSCYLQRKKCPLYRAKYVLLRTGYGTMSVVRILTLHEADPLHPVLASAQLKGAAVAVADEPSPRGRRTPPGLSFG